MVLIGIFMLNCLILASLSNVKSKAIEKDLDKIVKEQSAKTLDSKTSEDQGIEKQSLTTDSDSNGDVNDSSSQEVSKNKKSNKKTPLRTPIVPAVE